MHIVIVILEINFTAKAKPKRSCDVHEVQNQNNKQYEQQQQQQNRKHQQTLNRIELA